MFLFMLFARFALIPALFLSFAASAQAASSDWHHVEGGSVRIVTSGKPDAKGIVRGALEIRLEPGWKTYWIDPGSSGVPPTLTITMGDEQADVEIGFPPPQRFDDGYGRWSGYDGSVALALTLRLPPGEEMSARVEADAFLGVCETICIPVQTDLTFNPYDDADDPEHKRVVEAAFASLPQPADDKLGARAVGGSNDEILVQATVPDGTEALDLFVAGTETLVLGVPKKVSGADDIFSVPVLHQDDAAAEMLYTLITSEGAVTGSIPHR